MEEIIESLRPISRFLDRIQSILALNFLDNYLIDVDGRQKSLGRVGIVGCFLGILWGVHFSVGSFLICFSWVLPYSFSRHKIAMITTWCFYIVSMCTFHLLEFFVTAFFNPNVVASDSFLVNHSKAYTVAYMIATTEFWVRFWFGHEVGTPPYWRFWWTTITLVGVVMVMGSQIIRSWAMMKCGESFNHYIQTERKQNHILVTDGVYTWFRHPSYTGFYYWSIGTQMVLHNPFSAVLFAVAGWKFFSQRIPYEERSLIRLFGDEYYNYIQRTFVGIPFIPSLLKDEDRLPDRESQHQGKGRQTEEAVEVELESDKGNQQKKTD